MSGRVGGVDLAVRRATPPSGNRGQVAYSVDGSVA
jgi:hypothetical protein